MLISILVLVAIWLLFMIIYNRFITLRNNRENAFADIDVQLKQRFDLVPNLINTVKWYASHEKEIFEQVTKSREKFLQANTTDEKIEADNALAGALKSVFAIAENYPDLKANQNFAKLQDELADIENKIASSRRFFNSATKEYNISIEKFPWNIIANMFGFKKESMFEIVDRVERRSVKVEF